MQAETFRSEIGHAVEMAVKGWKRDRNGRGFWKRRVKQLVNDPATYEVPPFTNPRPAEPAPQVHVCMFCFLEINGALCCNWRQHVGAAGNVSADLALGS